MDPGERLRVWWKATDVDVPANSSAESETAALEARYRVKLPDEFRRYLVACPGGVAMDDYDGAWWPIHAIRNVTEEYPSVRARQVADAADKYLVFADYMIWCWAWAICCDDGPDRGKVAVIGGDPDRIIADSFGEFVELYFKNSGAVL